MITKNEQQAIAEKAQWKAWKKVGRWHSRAIRVIPQTLYASQLKAPSKRDRWRAVIAERKANVPSGQSWRMALGKAAK